MIDVPATALNALIDSTMRRNGWTDYEEIVRRAKSRGAQLTKQDLSNFRHHVNRTLVPSKVSALAAGLELQPYMVATAVLADYGIVVPIETRRPEDAVAHDHTLSGKARKFLLAILAADRED